jgi:hypothetical protein
MTWPSEWDWPDLEIPAGWYTAPVTLAASLVLILADLQRVLRILDLRAMPYPQYLQSDWWQQVRAARLDLVGRRCEWHDWRGRRCPATTGLNVHHVTYRRLGDEDLDDVVVFCSDHHRAAHGKG